MLKSHLRSHLSKCTSMTWRPSWLVSIGLAIPVCEIVSYTYTKQRRHHVICSSSNKPPSLHEIHRKFAYRGWRRMFSTEDHQPCKTPADVAEYLQRIPEGSVIVMAGAGISTLSGIPDFRNPETGLYQNLEKYHLPYAEAIFDIDYFSRTPEPFFQLAQELYPSGVIRPNIVHYFVRLLHEKKLLKRMYTQNIDGLERLAGIPENRLVEAHGTFDRATCRKCRTTYSGRDIEASILQGTVPRCKKKSCNGVVKPNIVFYGEQLPGEFYLYETDMPAADLLIILGTSLQVNPFAGIADAVSPSIPRILFDREPVANWGDRSNDVLAQGELFHTVKNFCELLGWWEELQNLMDRCESEAGQQTKPTRNEHKKPTSHG